MKGALYRRWLADDRGVTLGEFVAERRADARQARAQRRWAQHMGPLMQQAPPEVRWQHMAALQNAPLGMYRGIPVGGLSGLLGLFR